MAVTIANADNALKSIYLDVVSEQLNYNTNPFLAKIKQSTNDVWGKEVRKLAVVGINGGIGAGTEDGNLPSSVGNEYKQFVAPLKNLYGTIEISDKAVRASENNAGAFVNLLNAEMDGLVKASSFNLDRMLFGNGTGILATIVNIDRGCLYLDSTKNLAEGMVLDFFQPTGQIISSICGRKVSNVNRAEKYIEVTGDYIDLTTLPQGSTITIQNSKDKEITGINALFDDRAYLLYGLNKEENPWMKPYIKNYIGEISEIAIQTAIDSIEENSGSSINFIVCSWGVRRALQKVLAANNRNIDTMELAGGYKAMSYNGIPIVVDRFCPEGTMYLLNTDDFTLHQLCDWQWLADDDGKVLKQVAGKPVYTATLVKYAELICSRPNGQGMISGITEE